jgi:uncharacterized membrane-anchored protein
MNNKKILTPVFIIVALVQLYIPAKMIWDREDILETGNEYRFRSAAIDPFDPFRGKYITLTFEASTYEVSNGQDWSMGETIYVSLETDKSDFAKIKSVSKEKPSGSQDFVKARVRWVNVSGANILNIEYPFDRYYMEESKAADAELTYMQSQRDSSEIVYALVSVKNGDAVLKDVFIDGTSLREIVKLKQESNQSR